MIITNKAKCLNCGNVLESHHRHDFKRCSCGTIAVDGGREYIKRCGYPQEYEELSIVDEKKD